MRQFLIVPVQNHNPHDWEAGIDGTGHRDMQSLSGWLQKEYCPQPQGMQIVHPYTPLCNAHGGALLRYIEHRGWQAPEKVVDDRFNAYTIWQSENDQMVRDYLVRVNEHGLILVMVRADLVGQALIRVGGTSYTVLGKCPNFDGRAGHLLRVDKDIHTMEWLDYRPFLLPNW